MVKPFVLGDNEVTKTMDVAVIDNEGKDEDSIVSKAYAWIKIKGIYLHDPDKRTMLWLYGTHLQLSAMQFFLIEQFPQVKGLEDTALVRKILPESVQVFAKCEW